MRDLIVRQIEERLPGIVQNASASAGARGISGSGNEATLRAASATRAQTDAANTLNQFGAQQAGQLANFAQNRAGFELTRNQQLFQSLLQSYQPLQNLENNILNQEQQRIDSEKGAFGNLVGSLTGLIPGIGGGSSPQPQQPAPPSPGAPRQ